MKKRSYMFTNKKQDDRAIMSTILGIISMVSMGIVIYLTYKQDGVAKPGYGVTGLLAMIFSLTGLVLGVLTAKEKENFKLFPLLGIVLNAVVLAGLGFIVYLGAYSY